MIAIAAISHLFYLLQRFGMGLLACLILSAVTTASAAVKVEIEGLPKPLETNVRATLNWQAINTDNLSEAYLQERLKQSEQNVKTALTPFGYYQSEVSSSLTKADKAKHWVAHYNVQLGAPARIRKLNVELQGMAQQDPLFENLTADFPLQPQQVLVHSSYEQGKTQIIRRLSNAGYLDATQTKAEVAVTRANNTADITLQWRSGKAYQFGELDVENPHIDTRLLTRWADFQTGDRFDYGKLLKFQRRLDSSGFFEFTHIEIDSHAETGIADVIVDTAPAAKRLYKASVGYGTDTGARTQLGFEQHWLNRRGHSFAADTRLAEREQSYSLRYSIPALSGRADSYNIGWQHRDQQLAEYDSRSSRFSIVQLSHTERWQIQLGLNFELDSFTIGTTPRSDTLWYIESNWSRFTSNLAVFPSRAKSLSINGRVGAGFDSEQAYFSRLHLQYLLVRPAPWDGRVLLKAAAGAVKADNFTLLPPQHRFYSGGDRNVRGFAYQSLSPVDSAGNKVGGRYLTELSLETDYRFAENWAVAAFVDAGQAFSRREHDLAVGAGLGLRFITSLLVIRIDVANAISEADKPWRLHLSLGTDF